MCRYVNMSKMSHTSVVCGCTVFVPRSFFFSFYFPPSFLLRYRSLSSLLHTYTLIHVDFRYFRRTDTRGTENEKSCVKSSQLYKKISNKHRIMSAGNAWLELLLAHHADQLRNELDVLVAFVHWCYISNGFVGIGSPPANFELTPARAATLLRGLSV